MSADGQRTKWCRNIVENFNRLSKAHERYRQTTDRKQTDGRSMTYSKHMNLSSRSLIMIFCTVLEFTLLLFSVLALVYPRLFLVSERELITLRSQ